MIPAQRVTPELRATRSFDHSSGRSLARNRWRGRTALERLGELRDSLDVVTGGFYKDPFGVVHLKGILAARVSRTSSRCPPDIVRARSSSSSYGAVGTRRLDGANGKVGMIRGGGVTLDGVTFRAGE